MREEKILKGILKGKIKLSQSLLIIFMITGGLSYAVDNVEGKGIGTAWGTGSNAKESGTVAVGGKASASTEGAVAIGNNTKADGNSSISIGNGANVASNGYSLTSIAVGKNAYVLNGSGQQEYELGFDKGNWTVSGFIKKTYIPKDLNRIAGGIAIGTNSYVRTGSIQMGSSTYIGKMGGIDINNTTNREANIVNMTTIGTNAFNKGAMSTMVGAYSIATGNFDGSGGLNSYLYGSQNFGAVSVGALNSIRSKDGNGNSGIANSVVGLANIAEKSNGALIFGAGNKITNSLESISGSSLSGGADSVDDMVDKTIKLIKDSKSGGSTLAIGGGNEANYTKASAMIGVNNKITGNSSNEKAVYNMVNGHNNTITNSSKNIINGINFDVKETEGTILLGFNDGVKSITSKNAIIIGNNANVTVEDGIALGNTSVANREAFTTEKKGIYSNFDLNGKTLGAISVGTDGKLRQIINVGDATEDTDAVNLRQLKAVASDNAIHYVHINSNDSASPEGTNWKNDGARGENSIVIGRKSLSEGNNSVVLGNSINLTGNKNNRNNSVVLGNDIEVDGSHNAILATDYYNYDNKTTHVFGEQNTVIGIGNLVGWDAENKNGVWEYKKSGSGSDQNTVLGMTNTVKGGSVVVGNDSTVDSLGISFGYGNNVIGMDEDGGQHGIALGSYLKVKGEDAIAIGRDGEATSDYAVAIGTEAKATSGHAIAVGTGAKVEKSITGVSLGYGSNTTVDYGIALGAFSSANREAGKIGYDILIDGSSKLENEVWKAKLGAVSIGDENKGYTRQITGVAAGTEDTDAVNVAQLKKINEKIITTGNNKANVDLDNITNNGKDVITALTNIKGENGISVEAKVDETSKQKTYTLKLDDSIKKNISKEESVVEAKNGMVSVKQETTNSTGGKEFILDLKQEIKNKIDNIGIGEVKAGDGNTVTGDTVYKYVKDISSNMETEIYYKAENEMDKKTVLLKDGLNFKTDGNIKAVTENNGVIKHSINSNLKGIESISNEGTKVYLTKDGISVNDKKITGIANGKVSIDSKDAVNGSQLYETNSKIESIENISKQQNKEIYQNKEKIIELNDEVNHVGSLGAAMAALNPVQYDPLQPTQIMAGLGHYKNSQAVAVGAAHYVNENLLLTAGVAIGGEKRTKSMANIGVTWKVGRDDDRKDLPERYKEGPIGSIYKMQEEMEQVIGENKELKNKLESQDVEIKNMKRQIEFLMKNKK